MANSNLVAERDGVMLKVGNEVRQLYRDGAVPDGADADHVKLLVERGLLVEADVPNGEDEKPTRSRSSAKSES